MKNYKKIDIHCHTTMRPLNNIAENNASMEVIRERMLEFNVESTVLLASYFPHKGSGISNYRLLNWMRNYHVEHSEISFVMFASLDFEHYFNQGYNEIEELACFGDIAGIKIYSCYQDIDYEGENMKRLLALAAKYDLPVMFHGGYSRGCMRKYGRPAFTRPIYKDEMIKLAADFAPLPIIVSHMNTPFQGELIEAMKAESNIYTDTSGLVSSAHDKKELPEVIEIAKRVIGEVGPERVMFGTDFPVQTHADSVAIVEGAMFGLYDEEILDRVYYENAKSIFDREWIK
jgi:predicted TIM-barrel fold metal-dependent hydrolase